jgi:hypothetical protein
LVLFQRFTAIQELQLQEILIDFFGNTTYASKSKIQVFLLLFSCKGPSTHYKVELLCKLVSMAVALKTQMILDYTAAWMRVSIKASSTYSAFHSRSPTRAVTGPVEIHAFSTPTRAVTGPVEIHAFSTWN